MTTYQGLLQRRIELYLNGAWVDFSSHLLTQTLSPNPGRTGGANEVTPAAISFSLDNPTGDLTPFRAESTYYPNVDVGMLVRYSVYWSGVWYVRGVYEATEVTPYWPYGDLSDGTTTGEPGESYVEIAAADILRRLSDDEQPLRSPLYRTMSGITPDDVVPLAYWPGEDGADSTQVASGLASGSPMTISGPVSFAAESNLVGSKALITLGAGASLSAPIPVYTDAGKWFLNVALNIPSEPASQTILMEARTTGGSIAFWRLLLTPGSPSQLEWQAYDGAGTALTDVNDIIPFDGSGGGRPTESQFYGNWFMFVLGSVQRTTTQVGGSAGITNTGSFVSVGGFQNTGTHSAIRSIRITAASGTAGFSIGHLGLFVDSAFVESTGSNQNASAMLGHAGEAAGRRLERLHRERGISFTSSGDLDETAAMGPEPEGSFIEVVRECEATDLGIFHAQRDALGTRYRTRVDLYNQTPALTLDAAQNEVANPFRPLATAKHIVNDVTANRPDGSSAHVADQDSIDRVGYRPRDYDANTETDSDLLQVAGWLLNLGTPDGMYYPSVSTELTIATQNIPDWLALNLGDRIQVINLPPQHPSDTVDLLVDGYTDSHSPSRWTPQINCSPAAPWDVAELDDDNSGKLDTDGSDLTAAVNSSATSLSVATQTGTSPLWITGSTISTPAEFPIPLLVSGEVMSATAIAAPTTITYGAVGTAAHGNNASVVPGLPGSLAQGNLMVMVAAIRNSGTGVPNTPSGWTRLPVFAATDNVQIFAKVAGSSESAPTVSFASGVANADTSAQIIRIVGAFSDPSECFVVGNCQLNASAQNIAYPQLALTAPQLDMSVDNCIVIYVGWKQDDFTSVATLAGATEIAEASTTTGDDQSLVWDYVIQTTATNIAAGGSFTVTGGASAISRGAVFAIRSNVQAFTVTRSVNGVSKSHTAGTAVNVNRPARLAL